MHINVGRLESINPIKQLNTNASGLFVRVSVSLCYPFTVPIMLSYLGVP